MNQILFHTDKANKYDKMDYLHLSTAGYNLNKFYNNLADKNINSFYEGVNSRPFEQNFKKYPIDVSRPLFFEEDDNKTSILYNKTMYGYHDISGLRISNNNIPKPPIRTSKYQPIKGVIS